jgi:hypothetical protein
MKSEGALLDSIFQAALEGCDADVKAHKDALWRAAVTLLADVLRETDPFNRERRLRGLVAELRKSIKRLSELLDQPLGKLLH